MADCAGELRDKLGIAANDAKDILDTIRNYRGDARDKLLYAQAKADGLNRDAALGEFRAKQTAVNMADARTHVQRFIDDGHGAYQGVKSFLVGSDKAVQGARLSIESAKREAWSDVQGHMEKDLRAVDPNFKAWVNDKDFGNEVAKAMWSLRDPQGVPYKPPATPWGHKVMAFAETFDKYKEALRQRLNDNGADIYQAGQHVMPQAHDGLKLMKAGKDGWVDAIAPLLDEQRTFGGTAAGEFKTVLGKVYDKIVDGSWGAYTDERLQSGRGNLADSMGASRELHFKSAEDWLAYNQKFGEHDNIIRGIASDIRHKTESAALIEKMGSDPAAFYKKMTAGLDIKGMDVELANAQFKTVTGADRIPGSANVARYASAARSWLGMAHLGSSFFSQWPDLAVAASRARFNGIGYLDTYAGQLKGLMTGRNSGDLRDLMDSAGVFAEGALAHAHDRFSAADLPTGVASKLAEKFMTWNGMKYWDDVMREGAGLMLSHNIARNIDRGVGFDGLDKFLQASLQRYGIGAEQWAKLGAGHIAEVEGRRLLSVDAMPKDLGKAVRTYLTSEAEMSLPLPGAAERALALGGTQPGTISGEMRRFVAMYKLTALTTLSRVLPQTLQMGVGHTAFFLAGSTALGYLSYAAKEMAQGRTPPDPTQVGTMAASIVRGGGAGILGDLFIDSARDMRRSLADTLGGPALGIASDVFRVYQHAANLKEDTAAQTFRLVMNNLPLVNLFYTKTALNYLFTWHVQEALNPGYLSRTERRIQQEQGNHYFVPPSSVIQRGGGFR